MTKKRWRVRPADIGLQGLFTDKLKVLPLTAQLLINRGLVDYDRAFCFLNPELKALYDPFLMKDMDKGVTRIIKAVADGELIAVYGDYDVDGVTSAALLILFFRELGVDILWHIPARIEEGYGLNAEAIKKLAALDVKVIITVDCGVSDFQQVKFANTLGIDVIISDHHELPSTPPDAHAILNARQKGCAFPFKGLAGVGVAFNLIMALRSRFRQLGRFASGNEPNLKKYLDLVCIGTIADLAPLADENRILVSYGLKELENTERVGLKALKDVSGVRPGRLDADTVAYQLAPRINAAGRVGHAVDALRLLITEDPTEAARLAVVVNEANLKRQKIELDTLIEAEAMIGEGYADRGIVLHSGRWHPGVIGIVASKLVDRFWRPVVMLSVDGGVGKGSARGISGFNLLEGLEKCSAHLTRYGGHKAAAGMSLPEGNIDKFREEFIGYVNRALTDADLVREITIDAVVNLSELDLRAVNEINGLAPFGAGNATPVLCLRDADIISSEVVGGKHLRMRISQQNFSGRGIAFNRASLHPLRGKGFSLAFSPYVDEWNGTKNLNLRVKDIASGGEEIS